MNIPSVNAQIQLVFPEEEKGFITSMLDQVKPSISHARKAQLDVLMLERSNGDLNLLRAICDFGASNPDCLRDFLMLREQWLSHINKNIRYLELLHCSADAAEALVDYACEFSHAMHGSHSTIVMSSPASNDNQVFVVPTPDSPLIITCDAGVSMDRNNFREGVNGFYADGPTDETMDLLASRFKRNQKQPWLK